MPNGVSENFFEEYIGGRIIKHDRSQFEVKLNYNLDPQQKINRYKVSMYMFIPLALDITQETYTKQRFFHDIKSFIRFQNPKISIESLLEKNNPLSPFYQLNIHLESKHDEKIIHELKLLACIIKSNLSNEIYKLSHAEVKKEELAFLVKEIDTLAKAVSELRGKIISGDCATEVKEALRFADEYISIVIESNLTSLLENAKLGREWEKEILKRVTSEQEYRKKTGYRHGNYKDDDENILYHFGILKKYISNVLFLEVKDTKADEKSGNFVGAIAAGIAMVVFSLFAVISQTTFTINSLPFLLLLIIGYMIKDRIKELTKLYFGRKLARFFPDKSFHIYDPSFGDDIGLAKESMTFIKEDDVPEEIEQIRNKEHLSKIEEEGRPEAVIYYIKRISLKTKKITEMHKRVKDINDIIRFNIIEFLNKADEPSLNMTVVSDNKLTKKRFAKVYHVNVVFKLNYKMPSGEEVSRYKRIRVVLDKLGIRRIEEVS